MAARINPDVEKRSARPSARTLVGRFAVWFLPAAFLCIIIARVAVLVQSRWAPIGLFSAVVGVCAGAAIAGFVRLAGIEKPKSLLLCTLALSLLTTAAQHYFFFRDHRQAAYQASMEQARKQNPLVEIVRMPPPELGFKQFVRFVQLNAVDRRQVGIWIADAVICAIVSCATVSLLVRSEHSADRKS